MGVSAIYGTASTPGLRVLARGVPASGLQRVIYGTYVGNVIYALVAASAPRALASAPE